MTKWERRLTWVWVAFFSDHLPEEVHRLKDPFRAQGEKMVVDMCAGALHDQREYRLPLLNRLRGG